MKKHRDPSSQTQSKTPSFMKSVEGFFLRRRGVGVLLSNQDLRLLRKWQKMGVPVEVVLRGVEAAFEARQTSRAPTGISFALPWIEQTVSDYFRVHPGAQIQPQSWATPLAPTYDDLKAQLTTLGQSTELEHVRDALRHGYRTLHDLEQRTPQPSPIIAWRHIRRAVLERLEAQLTPEDRTQLRKKLASRQGLRPPPRGGMLMSPRAARQHHRQRFKRILAKYFGLESLMRAPQPSH